MQTVYRLTQNRNILIEERFAEFKFKQSGLQIVLAANGSILFGKVRGMQMLAGEIDGDRAGFDAFALPLRQFFADSGKDIFIHTLHQVVFFQNGNKRARGEKPADRMPPTDQCFCTENAIVAQLYLGLQVYDKIVIREGTMVWN